MAHNYGSGRVLSNRGANWATDRRKDFTSRTHEDIVPHCFVERRDVKEWKGPPRWGSVLMCHSHFGPVFSGFHRYFITDLFDTGNGNAWECNGRTVAQLSRMQYDELWDYAIFLRPNEDLPDGVPSSITQLHVSSDYYQPGEQKYTVANMTRIVSVQYDDLMDKLPGDLDLANVDEVEAELKYYAELAARKKQETRYLKSNKLPLAPPTVVPQPPTESVYCSAFLWRGQTLPTLPELPEYHDREIEYNLHSHVGGDFDDYEQAQSLTHAQTESYDLTIPPGQDPRATRKIDHHYRAMKSGLAAVDNDRCEVCGRVSVYCDKTCPGLGTPAREIAGPKGQAAHLGKRSDASLAASRAASGLGKLGMNDKVLKEEGERESPPQQAQPTTHTTAYANDRANTQSVWDMDDEY